MTTKIVEGALAPQVKDKKDSEARLMVREIKRVANEAHADKIQVDVLQGVLFVSVEGEEAEKAVSALFTSMPEVHVADVSPMVAIQRKSLLKRSGSKAEFV